MKLTTSTNIHNRPMCGVRVFLYSSCGRFRFSKPRNYSSWFIIVKLSLILVSKARFRGKKTSTHIRTLNKNDWIKFSEMKYCATKSILDETNEFVEKFSGILDFILTISVPICVDIPSLAYNLFVYYTTDLGKNSFQLPCPTW